VLHSPPISIFSIKIRNIILEWILKKWVGKALICLRIGTDGELLWIR
jgi:hypothetical protein